LFVTSANSRIEALTQIADKGESSRQNKIGDQAKTISTQDIQVVSKKFDELRVAFTKSQWNNLLRHSGISEHSQKLLTSIKNSKLSYRVEVRNVHARQEDQSIYASLHIAEVSTDTGELLRPERWDAVIPLSSKRTADEWSEIEW